MVIAGIWRSGVCWRDGLAHYDLAVGGHSPLLACAFHAQYPRVRLDRAWECLQGPATCLACVRLRVALS